METCLDLGGLGWELTYYFSVWNSCILLFAKAGNPILHSTGQNESHGWVQSRGAEPITLPTVGGLAKLHGKEQGSRDVWSSALSLPHKLLRQLLLSGWAHSRPWCCSHAPFPWVTSSRHCLFLFFFFEDWFLVAGEAERWAYSLAKMTPDLLKYCNTEDSKYYFGNTTNFVTFFGPSWFQRVKTITIDPENIGVLWCQNHLWECQVELEERGTEPNGGWRIWKADARSGRKKLVNSM